VTFPDWILLAPMAGVADYTYRFICRELGCRGAYTEMVSAKGLCYKNQATAKLLKSEGGWLALQLFGNEPQYIEEAVNIVDKQHFSAIDLNMGCPVAKVCKSGEGAAVMRTPGLAGELVKAAKTGGLPVTVKMRLGWDDDEINFMSVAEDAVKAGAVAVCLHARTRAQGYSGRADWGAIAMLKKRLNVPVLASGDILTPQDALRVKEITDCDAVLAARGALGNPWFFAQTHALERGETIAITANERAKTALRHAALLQRQEGERALPSMRKHIAWYTKGLPGAAKLRQEINFASTLQDFERLLR